MNSAIYSGHVMHLRTRPVRHGFRYPVFFFALDLDELPELNRRYSWFGHNRVRPVSLHDRDYLHRGPEPIREKLGRVLEAHGCADRMHRVKLVTALRIFNYVFNPVSFYYVYDSDNALVCTVAEVNNTFYEKHIYVLTDPGEAPKGFLARYTADKEFHVSPFFDRTGSYDFWMSPLGDALDIRVNLMREGSLALTARMTGTRKPLTTSSMALFFAAAPLRASITFPRIVWEAARLYYRKGLPVYQKPIATSEQTIRVKAPTWRQRACMTLILRFLQSLDHGQLHLRLPEGDVHTFGPDDGEASVLHVHDYQFFVRIMREGSIGFGESYMDGEWTTDDLPRLLTLLLKNLDHFKSSGWGATRFSHWTNSLLHWFRTNTRTNSRKNIRAHYDLSNDFFQTFLDPTMTYSCAIFDDQDEDLQQAQYRKLDTIIRKAGIQAEQHVLEIGSGWGSFAIRAVQQTGCRVTTITLSQEQKRLAEERIAAAGLSERIEVKLCDYRDIEGQYDHIISIEMLEAVGHKFLPTYFQTCDRLLKPNGSVVLQVITIPEAYYETYRRGCDWIQKYIFPGGCLPSVHAMTNAINKSSRFMVEHLENYGMDYAKTISEWRERFSRASATLDRMGFDDMMRRTWLYYFAYCEAGFQARSINLHQVVLTRPREQYSGTNN